MDLVLGIMIALLIVLLGLLPFIAAKIEKLKNNKEKAIKLKRIYTLIWILSIILFITMATREVFGYYSKDEDKNEIMGIVQKTADTTGTKIDTATKKITDNTDQNSERIIKLIPKTKPRPKGNTQTIDSGGSGIQNNAPNYGNQAGRDLIVNAERTLSHEEQNELLRDIKKFKTARNTPNCCVIMMTQTASGKIVNQIKDLLLSNGYDAYIQNGSVGIIGAEVGKYHIGLMSENCMLLTVGIYK